MHFIIRHFGGNADYNGKDSYKAVERIFYEQCEVHENKVSVKQKAGGHVMQNPSDPDAKYDGHKGQGYQVQISETCNRENEVQLITCAIPQTATESDANAVEEVLQDLKANDLAPDEILADTNYSSDENVQLAAEQGVELIGPVTGCSTDEEHLNIDDFNIDEVTAGVICCPAVHNPQSAKHDSATGKTNTDMQSANSSKGTFRTECTT